MRTPIVLLLLTGCAGLTSSQTADTLGHGHLQIGLEPSLAVLHYPKDIPSTEFDIRAPVWPTPAVSARYGLTDRLDVGARVGMNGAELLTKIQLTPRDERALVLSLAPSVGAWVYDIGGADSGYSVSSLNYLVVPLLVGVGVGEHSQVVLGPRVRLESFLDYNPQSGFQGVFAGMDAGGSLGVAFQVRDDLRLLPEVGILYPVAGPFQHGPSAGDPAFAYQFTLGILVGGDRL